MVILSKGSSASFPNAVLGHMRDDQRSMSLINVAHFMEATAKIIPLDRPVPQLAKQVLRYQGHHKKALLWNHLYKRGCLWNEILSQQRIRHFMILQSTYFANDVGIISSKSNRIVREALH